jgi:glycosyltransferase involved in cell wall biosynthesis
MNTAPEILIWVPLTPGSSWRGEGIAQTIEHIVLHSNADTYFHIVCLGEHADDIREGIKGHVCHIKITAIRGKLFQRSRREMSFTSRSFISTAGPRFFGRLWQVFLIPNKTSYVLFVTLTMLWFRFFKSKPSLVWTPVLGSPYSHMNFGRKKIVNFWDPFVFEYEGFRDIRHPLFEFLFERMAGADHIITQSEHNRRYLEKVLSVPAGKISVIPVGCPSYSKFLRENVSDLRENQPLMISSLWQEKAKTAIVTSIDVLRNRVIHDLLNQSTFYRLLERLGPSSRVIIISTQERPYKGFDALLELCDALVKSTTHDYHFIFTGNVDFTRKSSRLKYNWIVDRTYSITRTDRTNHSLLYQLSDLAIHPSFAEGGLGSYPQFEASSVGTPCLINRGRHSKELIEQTPEISECCFDILNTEDAKNKVEALLSDVDAIANNVAAHQLYEFSLEDQSTKYGEVFSGDWVDI